MAGRPSSYTEAIGDEIARRLAEGESLRRICGDSHLPNKSTVLLWVVDGKHEAFSDQYRRAREAAGYSHADEIVDLVREMREGSIEPNVARVMAGNLQWAAERMAPKSHSPKQEVEHSGNTGAPLQVNIVRDDGSTD